MTMDVTFREDSKFVTNFGPTGHFSADFGQVTEVVLDAVIYNGPTTVNPIASDDVVLPTKDKTITKDITVKKIARYDVSNDSGTTVYIA